MKKIVNVNAIYPITGVKQIVRGRLFKASMSTEDIFKCLCAKATVDEVIGDKTIRLNFDNYDKPNKIEEKPAVIPTVAKPVTTNVVETKLPEPLKVTETIMTNPPIIIEEDDTATISDEVYTEENIAEGTIDKMTAIEVPVGEEYTLSTEDDVVESGEETTAPNKPVIVNNRKKHHK